MGYEVQMIVGRVHKGFGVTDNTKDKDWFKIYATVDLCKPGECELMKLSNSTKANEIYVFAIMGDGDTPVVEDRYGESMVPIPIQDVLEALYIDQRNDHYRRFRWAIALLESMVHEEDGQLSVTLWGY